MRNVNYFIVTSKQLLFIGFILTMRNVNVNSQSQGMVISPSFILTMRNVNSYNLQLLLQFLKVLY